MSKLPKHLQPLYDELEVTYKDGKFTNESGSVTYKTAKEAIEHNQQIDKFASGFSFKPTNTKTFRQRVNKSPDLNIDINLFDELSSIRQGLQNLKAARPAATVEPKSRTSTGLNYIMGFDDD